MNLMSKMREEVALREKLPEIKVGQHWQEVGERRVVEIVHLHNLQTVRPVAIRTLPDGRRTYASVERFNGKRGGYRLVKDVA